MGYEKEKRDKNKREREKMEEMFSEESQTIPSKVRPSDVRVKLGAVDGGRKRMRKHCVRQLSVLYRKINQWCTNFCSFVNEKLNIGCCGGILSLENLFYYYYFFFFRIRAP